MPKGCDDKVQLDVRTAVVDGTKGSFVLPPSMNRIHFVLTECVPGYQELIAKQARALELDERAVRTASAALAAKDVVAKEERERADHWKEAWTDEHKALVDEREANDGVLRSPVFWMTIGVAVGAGATIGIAYALKGAREVP